MEAIQLKTYSMPLFLIVRKNKKGGWKKDSLTLNQMNNWHHRVRHKLKMRYEQLVAIQIADESFGMVEIDYVLIPPDKRARDRANFISIHEKFFCDALVKNGVLKDDTDKFIRKSTHTTGPIDKGNGRVEITVKEVS